MGKKISLEEEIKKTQELLASLRKKQAEQQVELSTVALGEIVKIAGWDFIVVNQNTWENETSLLSKDLLLENMRFGDNTNYMESNVKDELKKEILPKIEDAVGKNNICTIPTDFTAVNGINEYGSTNNLQIRPLTFEEVREFAEFIPNEDLKDYYWTCTPWSTKGRGYEKSMSVVSPSGDFLNCHYYDYNLGVRPFCILKSNIFVSKGEQ